MSIDMQRLIDTMNELSRNERSKYHLTLGQLVSKLQATGPECSVRYDFEDDSGPGSLHSYRGYYSDLSLGFADVMSVKELLERCNNAWGTAFEGYKGGQFVMANDTPLWAAQYGCCGRAITGAKRYGNILMLESKELDVC